MHQQAFREPKAGFRPAAYWFWHKLPNDREIQDQLLDFRDRGYSTILIQARLALPRELYLSDAFLDRYRKAVEVMREIGLVAGLYDDYNWTSGQAGGRTVSSDPHLSERHLFWASTEASAGEISGIEAPFATGMGPDIANWIYDGGRPRFGEWELVAAVSHNIEANDVAGLEDITDLVSIVPGESSCRFTISGHRNPGQRVTVFLSARCVTSRLINYLLPEAGARFVEMGLEPYARALEGLIPQTLQFLFYDQPGPQFYNWEQQGGNLGNSLLYSASLREAIEDLTGLSFGSVMFSLLYDVGPLTAALRIGFYETYFRLMHEAFFGPVKTFCTRYGLRMTGHEILPHVGGYALNGGFSSIDPRVAPAVDFFGMDRLRDETAVDANNFIPQLSPKLGDSVARAHGRTRTMVEVYTTATRTEQRGAGQWELTPTTLRAQSIRMHMAGARQIITHALYQISGEDNDTRLFVNPRFDFAPGLNFEPWWKHHQGIADETARLSVFLEESVPVASVGILYPFASALAEGPGHMHGPHFGAWCEGFAKLSCGHMILDEHSIAKASIRDGKLYTNGLVFSVIVLPGVSRIASSAAITKLMEFSAQGGHIWASGVVPCSVTGVSLDCRLQFSDASSMKTIQHCVSTLPKVGPTLLSNDPISSTVGRDAEGWWRIVLFNNGDTDEEVRLTLGDGFLFELWNAEEGRIIPARSARSLTVVLEQHDLLCLRLREQSGAKNDIHIEMPVRVCREIISLDSGWTFRPAEGGDAQSISVLTGWQNQGYASYSGTGFYECIISLQDTCRAVVDLPGVAVAMEVWLDDCLAGQRARPPFRIDLGEVEAGTHRLALKVSNTAANRFYAGTPYAGEIWPDESGLTATPRLFLLPATHSEETV